MNFSNSSAAPEKVEEDLLNSSNSRAAVEAVEEDLPGPWENMVAAGVLFSFTFFCLVVNASVAVVLSRMKSMRSQFAFLCVSLACCDCGVLTCFAFWASPLTITQNVQIAESFVGKAVGSISLLCYFASLYAVLAIAVNRFLAIVFPIQYKIYSDTKNTVRMIVATWVIGFLCACITVPPGCNFYWHPVYYVWMYSETYCGGNVQYFLDFAHAAVMGGIIFIINSISAFKMRMQTKVLDTSTEKREEQAEKRRKKERRFFIQSCLNATALEVMLICFHVVAIYVPNRWGWFWSTGVAWAGSHSCNGFLLLVFNRDLRKSFIDIACCLRENPKAATVYAVNNDVTMATHRTRGGQASVAANVRRAAWEQSGKQTTSHM